MTQTGSPILPAGYHPPDLVLLGARELSEAIRSRRVSCREAMTAYLDHIEALNPTFNAIVSLRDRETLLAEADARDAELARGRYRGWLHGIPHAVKDLAPTRGLRTTLGSPLYRDHVPEVDAIFVERLRGRGAIIIGKTNTPEFGLGSQTYNSLFGVTRNAYDPAATAGGSSGGAAVALALRMLPVADGSDMMGSLRNPAAYNNVIGFRPSFGRVPHGPGKDVFIQQFATEGPMGRSVADAAALLATLAGYDRRTPLALDEDPRRFSGPLERDFSGLRIGWLGDWDGHLPIEPGVMALCERALATFGEIGCTVEPARPDFPPGRLWETWLTLRQWMVAGQLREHFQDPAQHERLKPEARWEVERGLALTAMDVHRASAARSEWYHALCRLFESCDYLVMPSAQLFPFDAAMHWPAAVNGVAMDTYHRWMEIVVPGSLSGGPTINVPAGFSEKGLPMGLQILGPARADWDVLQIAHAYELASGWTRRAPTPVTGEGL